MSMLCVHQSNIVDHTAMTFMSWSLSVVVLVPLDLIREANDVARAITPYKGESIVIQHGSGRSTASVRSAAGEHEGRLTPW